MVFFERKWMYISIRREVRDVQGKHLHPAKSKRNLPRSHQLYCSYPVQCSDQYLARIHHLISARSVGHLLQDLLCIRPNQPLRTCCEPYRTKFAAHEAMVPRKFETLVCSRTRTKEQISYNITRFAEFARGVLRPIGALLSRKNQVTFSLL